MYEAKNKAEKVIFKTIHTFPLHGNDNPLNHGFVEAYCRITSVFKDVYEGMIEHSGLPNSDPSITENITQNSFSRWLEIFKIWGTDKVIISSSVISKFRHNYIAGQLLEPKPVRPELTDINFMGMELSDIFLQEFSLFRLIVLENPSILQGNSEHNGIESIIQSIDKMGLNAPFSHWLYLIDYWCDARIFVSLSTPSIHNYCNIEQLFETLE